MTEIKALDKLREYINERQTVDEILEIKCGDWEDMTALLSKVEQEIAERFMELPVDADGVPICMGDTVEGELLLDNATVRGTVCAYHIHDDDEPGTVYIRVKPTEDTWTIKELRFTRCRHVKPRTLEDVLSDYATALVRDANLTNGVAKNTERYANEIRELLGGAE